jgi:hypothetical protein
MKPTDGWMIAAMERNNDQSSLPVQSDAMQHTLLNTGVSTQSLAVVGNSAN